MIQDQPTRPAQPLFEPTHAALKTLFLLLASLAFIPCLQGQYALNFGDPAIKHYPRTVYHGGTQNWAIGQDYRGLMYFANNKGLLEFDGANWQVFNLPNGTIVRSINIDQQGRIYVGGQSEIGYLKLDAQANRMFTSVKQLIPKQFQSFEDVWKIFVLDQAVYYCSEKAIFKLIGNEVEVITPKSERFENFFSHDGRIYVLEDGKGLYYLENDRLKPTIDAATFANSRIVAMLPYPNATLIITSDEGLFLLKSDGVEAFASATSDFLKKHQAYCGIQLQNGNYAIGSTQNGYVVMGVNGEIQKHLNQAKGLQNNTILSIYQDAQENLWLGLDNGIDYVETNSPFSLVYSVAGIKVTGYTSIVHQGRLYLGTNQGLFSRPWSEETLLNEAPFTAIQNSIGQIWSLNRLGEQVIVGQHKGAAMLEDGKVKPFSDLAGAWKFLPLSNNPGYAIEGTYSGIAIYKNRKYDCCPDEAPEWEFLKKLAGFEESARIIEEDEVGNIWVSHAYKGLYKIALSENLEGIQSITSYTSENGLPVDLFINVTKIKDEIIFTTPIGAYQYDRENDHFIEHKILTELFGSNRNFHRLIEDEFGNIWFVVDEDFGVINVQEKGIKNKLELVYFNQLKEELVDGFEHIYAHDEQNVFIGTEKGFIHYNPSIPQNKAFPFELLIREVTSITNADSTLYWGHQPTTAEVETNVFQHKMNDFRFSYAAPYYLAINHLKYRFQLVGFEASWSDWSPKKEKEYTNLPVGDYQFKVQAQNAFGQLSTVATYPFKILPPWYLSIYARLTYFLLGLLAFFSIIRYIRQRERQKTENYKQEQQQKLLQKEAEFQQEVKKSESEIIKLRNDKLENDLQHKNSQLAAATMHLVQKGEILLKLKNDLKNLLGSASTENKKKIQQITRSIDADIRLDDTWEQFEFHFDQVHENFFKRLRTNYPALTPKDQKLCAYLRMNLTTKEIAPLLNISVRGVEISRYRLRKKLDLDSEMNLVSFILDI